ncbi:MAG TPA: hypothetical protein VMR86_00775 [Myxococcota bacterium]|nr:hypothetical protein [Myxococcota bacterium]
MDAALTRPRAAIFSLALLAVLGRAASADGATQTGILASDAAAVDYYQVTCSDDGSGAPASLAVQVQETSPAVAPLVSLQVQKAFAATNTTDPAGADTGASPLVALNGGAGAYDVFVDKSGAGLCGYALSVQCKTGTDGSGSNTGTAIAGITVSPPPIPALPGAVRWALAAALAALAACAARRRAS